MKSVVIPACNEEHAIGDLVRRVRRVLGKGTEIIVVENGSTDRTASVAERAGARVVRLGGRAGKGRALWAGFQEGRGDPIIVMDGDGQDAPEDIPRLLHALTEGADMAIGSRYIGVMENGAQSTLNRVATHGFTWVINRLWKANISDSQAGFRVLYRRHLSDCARSIPTGFEIETAMLITSLAGGRKIVEVPVTRRRREGGASKFKRIPDGLRILRTIIQLYWHGLAS